MRDRVRNEELGLATGSCGDGRQGFGQRSISGPAARPVHSPTVARLARYFAVIGGEWRAHPLQPRTSTEGDSCSLVGAAAVAAVVPATFGEVHAR